MQSGLKAAAHPPRPVFATARRAAPAVLAALAGLVAVASCTRTRVEDIPFPSGGTRAVRITDGKPAKVAPDPRTANLTQADLESSLRRIMVRYYGVTVWNKSDSQRLLSERLVTELAAVMSTELPRLADNQRLNFRFDDQRKGWRYPVIVNVYREGPFIVYRFDALAMDVSTIDVPTEPPRFGAELDAQPGQEVFNGNGIAYVKDPVLEDVRAAARDQQAKRALLDAALSEQVAGEGEKARLEALVTRGSPSLDSWKDYWDKRRTLRKALDQNLMDRAAYEAQVDKLTAELER